MTRGGKSPSPIHLRIARIVVDAGALGDGSREQLHADIGIALSQHLSGHSMKGPPTLAERIAGAVAPQVGARISARGGRNGAS
jgi:hypothetical protein